MRQYVQYSFLALSIVGLVGCMKSSFDPLQEVNTSGMPSIDKSVLSVTNRSKADGVTPVHVQILIKNQAGQPLPNVKMDVDLTGNGNLISPCPETDAAGISRCRVYSIEAGIKTVTATGLIKLSKQTEFHAVVPVSDQFAVVTSGSVEVASGGEVIISTSGIVESSAQVFDGAVMRLHSSIQNALFD